MLRPDSLFGKDDPLIVSGEGRHAPSTKAERIGWYAYDWANSVWNTVCIGLFVPIFLVNLAQTHATCGVTTPTCPSSLHDFAAEATNTSYDACLVCVPSMGQQLLNLSLLRSTYSTSAGGLSAAMGVALSSWTGPNTTALFRGSPVPTFLAEIDPNKTIVSSPPQMVVYFGGIALNPVSSTTTFISISVIIQVLVFISLGAMADYGRWRKILLVVWTVVGALAVIGFGFLSHHSMWWVAGLLTIIANVAYGASTVFYNAYLPILVDAHPDVHAKVKEEKGLTDAAIAYRDGVQNKMSTHGYAAGYLAGITLAAICVVLTMLMPGEGLVEDESCHRAITPPPTVQRLSIALAGGWWLAFSFITFFTLRTRAGPVLPAGKNYLLEGWKTLGRTIKKAKKYRDAFTMLGLWMLYSDGFSTIGAVGILFGQQDMCMGTIELVVLALEVPVCSLIGNYLFLGAQKCLKWDNKRMVICNLVLYSTLCVYGLIGLIPGVSFGLKSMVEIYIFAIVHGVCIGSLQSYSRTLFADIIPSAHEGEFFSLYGITDRGSSWIGPLIVAAVVQSSGQIRYVLFYILFVFVASIFGLAFAIDPLRGMKASGRVEEAEVELREEAEEETRGGVEMGEVESIVKRGEEEKETDRV